MKRRTVQQVLISVALIAGTISALYASTPASDQQRRTPPRSAPCWAGAPAVKNTDVGSKNLPLLPADLASKPVTRHTVALTLCIDEKGAVSRAVVVVSSGNTDVDAFFQRAVEKWMLQPATRVGKPVPSTADVSTSWTAR